MEFISEGHHVIQDYDFDRYEDMTHECLETIFIEEIFVRTCA